MTFKKLEPYQFKPFYSGSRPIPSSPRNRNLFAPVLFLMLGAVLTLGVSCAPGEGIREDGSVEAAWVPNRLLSQESLAEGPGEILQENLQYPGSAFQRALYGSWVIPLSLIPKDDQYLLVHDSSTARRVWLAMGRETRQWQKIAESGIPGTSAQTSVPQPGEILVRLPSLRDEGFLVVEVSNFHDPAPLTPLKFELFSNQALGIRNLYAYFFRFFIAGVLAYIIIHFLFFFFQRRQEPSALWIAIFSALVLIRHIATQRFLPDFLPGWVSLESFEFQIFLELATMYLMLPVFYTYLRNLYSLETQNLAEKTFWVLGSLSAASVAIFPLSLHYYLLLPNQIIILVGSLLVLFSFIRTLIHHRIGAGIAMAGFVVFFLTVVQDILHAQMIINTLYLAPYGFLAFLVSHSLLLSRTFAKAMKSTEVLNESLSRFVPKEFLIHLQKDSVTDVKLGDSNQLNMTVLFSDIRDFTTISEQVGAKDTFAFLNEYYGKAGPVIRRQGGYIDKYIGDAILALFPGPPENALKAAKDILSLVDAFNRDNSGRFPSLNIGIGIHSGELMLGTLGEEQRLDGTVISDTVNTASRIENKTKELKTKLLVSEVVLEQLDQESREDFQDLGEIPLKGKSRSIRLFGISELQR